MAPAGESGSGAAGGWTSGVWGSGEGRNQTRWRVGRSRGGSPVLGPGIEIPRPQRESLRRAGWRKGRLGGSNLKVQKTRNRLRAPHRSCASAGAGGGRGRALGAPISPGRRPWGRHVPFFPLVATSCEAVRCVSGAGQLPQKAPAAPRSPSVLALSTVVARRHRGCWALEALEGGSHSRPPDRLRRALSVTPTGLKAKSTDRECTIVP